MRKVLTMLTILSLAALALVACAAPGATGSEDASASDGAGQGEAGPAGAESAPEAPAAALDGTSWLLTGIDTGAGAEAPAAGRGEPTFRFEAGRIGGSAGCNRLAGSYTLEGERFSVGQMAGTRMACPEPLMTQENTVSAILMAAERAVVDGDTLTVSAADGRSLTFTRA